MKIIYIYIYTLGQDSSPYGIRYILEEQIERPVDVRARSTRLQIAPLVYEFQLGAAHRRVRSRRVDPPSTRENFLAARVFSSLARAYNSHLPRARAPPRFLFN